VPTKREHRSDDRFGVALRNSAFGEKLVEAARQVSGMRVITAIDRIWVET
jgi:hypothetical protein